MADQEADKIKRELAIAEAHWELGDVLHREIDSKGKTITVLTLIIFALLGLWLFDHDRQVERREQALSSWCPYWQTIPSRCE